MVAINSAKLYLATIGIMALGLSACAGSVTLDNRDPADIAISTRFTETQMYRASIKDANGSLVLDSTLTRGSLLRASDQVRPRTLEDSVTAQLFTGVLAGSGDESTLIGRPVSGNYGGRSLVLTVLARSSSGMASQFTVAAGPSAVRFTLPESSSGTVTIDILQDGRTLYSGTMEKTGDPVQPSEQAAGAGCWELFASAVVAIGTAAQFAGSCAVTFGLGCIVAIFAAFAAAVALTVWEEQCVGPFLQGLYESVMQQIRDLLCQLSTDFDFCPA